MSRPCGCSNGWLYATPGGWIPCHRCLGAGLVPASADRNPEGQDPQGLGAQHESAVPSEETGDAQPIQNKDKSS